MSDYSETDSDVTDPEEKQPEGKTIEEQQETPGDDSFRDEDLADEARK